MKIYVTNAALGYNQLAFLIRLDKTKFGYNYLCVDTYNINDSNVYQVGKVVDDLEDYYVEVSNYNLTDSPLHNTFLFNFFVEKYKDDDIEDVQFNDVLGVVKHCDVEQLNADGLKIHIVAKTTISNEDWGVHGAHCCIRHGCKYMYDDCPVVLGLLKQDYKCQDCD